MLKKVRFIEPAGASPYKNSLFNLFVYNKYIRNPSTGLITLATIVKKKIDDTLMYSESIAEIRWDDIYDADAVFIGINTFNAVRGYEIIRRLRGRSRAALVLGGMHASLNYEEAITHADYVLTGDGDDLIMDFIAYLSGENAGADSGVWCAGLVYKRNGKTVYTGPRKQPENIDTIPDRNLVYRYGILAKRYDTLWPQVHASRGCPHNCAYCAVVRHFGRNIRKRTPENVARDVEEAIAFHKRRFIPRLNTFVWITDDNFAHDRDWALSVLRALMDRRIDYHFSVQACFEIGFDDELLEMMKKAGFIDIALGIEFIDDPSFKEFNKQSDSTGIARAIKNIRRHGIGVRGLFIVGADGHTPGIGDRIADFVIGNNLKGALIQSLFFTPGTSFYEENKHRLIHRDWERYTGNVVHYPRNIAPRALQQEIIIASQKIYSFKRLLRSVLHDRWIDKVLFIGEYFWQKSLRAGLRKELSRLPPATPEPV